MLNSKLVNSILTGFLVVSLAVSILYSYHCVKHGRDSREMSQQIVTNQVNGALLQSLIRDCAVYSEKNSAINPILESIGLKVSTPAGASAKPRAK